MFPFTSIKMVIVFSRPAVPNDLIISYAVSNRSGEQFSQHHPSLQGRNRFVFLF
jgi:hypothetical protein